MPWASAGWRTRAWLAAAAVVVVAFGLVVVLAETGGPASTAAPTVTSAPATPADDPELRASVLGFVPILAGYAYRSDASSGVVDVGERPGAERPTGGRDCVALGRALDLTTESDSAAHRGDLYADLGYLQAVGGGAAVSTLAIELRVFAEVDAPPAAVSTVAASSCTELVGSIDVVEPDGWVHTLVVTAPVLDKERIEGGDPAVRVRMGPSAMSDPGGAPWHDSARADAVDDRTYLVARGAVLIRIRATDVADPDQAALAIAGQVFDHLGAR